MRVIAMFRVSTEQQAQDGASLDAQQRIYRELATAKKWKTIAEFRGCESASQAASEREVLQQALVAIRELRPDALYVHEQSRLTRGDELDVAALLRELREQSVKIIIGGIVRDLDSLDERFMVGIQSLVDRLESERIKERALRGKGQKAREGLKNSGPTAYGYRNPPPGHRERGRLKVFEPEAAVVRRMFSLAAHGYSTRRIAAQLNDEAIPSPRGGKWGKTSVVRVLENPLYIGWQVSGGWSARKGSRTFRFDPDRPGAVVVKDAHPAIVSKDVWDQFHGRVAPPRTDRPRMLTGVLELNGKPARGDTSSRRGFYRREAGSGVPWVPSDALDEIVWRAFVGLFREPDTLRELVGRSMDPEQSRQNLRDIQDCSARIAKLRMRQERLIEMRADGEIDKAVFAERSESTRRAIQEIEARRASLEAQQANSDPERVRQLVSLVRTLLRPAAVIGVEDRRAVLLAVTSRVRVHVKGCRSQQPRGDGGKYQRSQNRQPWRVSDVTFDLRLADSTGSPHLATAC